MNSNERPWIHKDILTEALKKYTAVDLAAKWKCDKRTIHEWAKRHDIAIHRSWPNKDIEYLKKYASTVSYGIIAKRLRRSTHSVRLMALALNLSIFDHIGERQMLRDVSIGLDVSIQTLYTYVRRHNLPVHKLRTTLIGRWHYVIESEIDEWLREGHILRFNPAGLNARYKKIYDAIRPLWVSQTELTACDPWLGHYSLHGHRKRGGTPPRPFITGRKSHPTYETYYLKSDLHAHYYLYADTIPLNIKCDWIATLREAWQSVYIMAHDLYEIVPRATVHRYQHIKGFPIGYYRAYYDRQEVVAWMEAHGWHDRARLIKSDPVSYQELFDYRESKRKQNLRGWEHATTWQ